MNASLGFEETIVPGGGALALFDRVVLRGGR
jgi:hypothetical protein